MTYLRNSFRFNLAVSISLPKFMNYLCILLNGILPKLWNTVSYINIFIHLWIRTSHFVNVVDLLPEKLLFCLHTILGWSTPSIRRCNKKTKFNSHSPHSFSRGMEENEFWFAVNAFINCHQLESSKIGEPVSQFLFA